MEFCSSVMLIPFPCNLIKMRGYCPRCKEYRSDNGLDAWRIIWRNSRPTCERCGSYVDVWNTRQEKKIDYVFVEDN